MPLRFFLGPAFGRRQRFRGLLSVARGLQLCLLVAAFFGQPLIFVLA